MEFWTNDQKFKLWEVKFSRMQLFSMGPQTNGCAAKTTPSAHWEWQNVVNPKAVDVVRVLFVLESNLVRDQSVLVKNRTHKRKKKNTENNGNRTEIAGKQRYFLTADVIVTTGLYFGYVKTVYFGILMCTKRQDEEWRAFTRLQLDSVRVIIH